MTIHPDLEQLIHAEIDGTAAPAEQAKLRDAIAGDPAVREEYRKLKGLSALLSQVAPEEPPATIAPSVMRAVRGRKGAVSLGLLARLRRAWPESRDTLRYAYAVAAGIVIGVVGLQIAGGGGLFGPAVPERDASATLLPKTGTRRLDLGPAGVAGVATLAPSASGTAIGLDLSSKEPVELVLRFDPSVGGGRVEVSVVRTGEAVPAGSLRLPKRD
jgi:anti-sigma factor RsiW